MKIKNYNVTHIETGSVRHHAGVSPTQLTSGEIAAETIASGYHTPPLEWNPDSTQWMVEESDTAGITD